MKALIAGIVLLLATTFAYADKVSEMLAPSAKVIVNGEYKF